MFNKYKPRMGRPKLEVTRAVLIAARFTQDEAASIEKAARASKSVKSEWIRESLLAAAGRRPASRSSPPPSPPNRFDQASEDFLD